MDRISASAGAGKTFELTRRYLSLLRLPALQDEQPHRLIGPASLLAVTFTNEAAREMRERALVSLKKKALGLKEFTPAHDWSRDEAERWVNRLLADYDALNIRTIDSLLLQLVRSFALEQGRRPDIRPAFDVGEFFEPVYAAFLDRAEHSSSEEHRLAAAAVDALLGMEDIKGFNPVGPLRDRLKKTLDFFLKHPEAALAGPEEEERIAALKDAVQSAALRMLEMTAGAPFHTNMIKALQKARPGLQQPSKVLHKALESVYFSKPTLVECVKKGGESAVGDDMEAAYAVLKAAAEEYRRLEPILRKSLVFSALLRPARMMARELEERQQRSGVLLSTFWAGLVLEAWQGDHGVPEAFFRMGTRLTHMLVDEFQDTSREQWLALAPLAEECLAKGGGLAVVGDVKQAIYGWRGGDVALFEEAPAELAHLCEDGVRRLALPVNWRSRQVVVEFNNTFFSPFAEAETARHMAEAAFESKDFSRSVFPDVLRRSFDKAEQELPPNKDASGGYVRLARLEPKKSDERNEAVLGQVRGLMLEILQRRSPSDVAVLVRSNDQAKLVAEELIAAGIPVITENSLNLAEHPLIKRLVAFLAFLDYPLDDAAFWEWITGRTPFGEITGLRPEKLHAWSVDRAEGPLFLAFKADFPEAWEAVIAPFYGGAGLSSAYDLLAEMIRLYELYDRYPGDALFLSRLLEVAHKAESEGYGTAANFLEYWQDKGVEAKVPLPEGLDAVRIMTIHKSKGLQFPVVVTPFLDFPMKVDEAPVLLELDGKALSVPLFSDMGEAYEERVLDRLLEQFHSLYVAWTRPEEELYAFFAPTKRTSPFQKALAPILDELFPEGEDVVVFGEPPLGISTKKEAEPSTQNPPSENSSLILSERPMAWLPRLAVRRKFDPKSHAEALLSPVPVMQEKERGTLIHAAADLLVKGLPLNKALDAVIAAAPCSIPDENAFRREAAADLEWLASLPEFPHWCAAGDPERPLLTAKGEVIRPDLVVFDDEAVEIVEFKTGRPAPEHEQQLRKYMRTMGEAVPGAAVSGVLVYLDGRRMQRLDREQPEDAR